MRKYKVTDHAQWRSWVTPKALHQKPIHRWCVFPHSFTSELVHALIDEWGLTAHDKMLDPFSGAGTTVLACREKGVPATGYDLSPLAALVCQAKVANYSVVRLREMLSQLSQRLVPGRWNGTLHEYPEFVRRALPGKLLGAFEDIELRIEGLRASETERRFFLLALLATIPEYSRAVVTGGWPTWTATGRRASSLKAALSQRVSQMIEDLHSTRLPRRTDWRGRIGDARKLPESSGEFSAVVTSPPYPNRHDYTRVFGVELMFGFLDWEETRRLRYQSFHSHPEAHPDRPKAKGYVQPNRVGRALAQIGLKEQDSRVGRMIDGYFLDLYIALREAKRVCKRKARIAFVVGNAQYRGVPILVDELTAELGELAGLECETIRAVRYRGNSAQQMGQLGRVPSRESVVILRKR